MAILFLLAGLLIVTGALRAGAKTPARVGDRRRSVPFPPYDWFAEEQGPEEMDSRETRPRS